MINTLGVKQNGHHLADGFLTFIFLYENCCILISLKFVAKGPINDKLVLV